MFVCFPPHTMILCACSVPSRLPTSLRYQRRDGSRQTPVAALIGNNPKPTPQRPSLLLHDQVAMQPHSHLQRILIVKKRFLFFFLVLLFDFFFFFFPLHLQVKTIFHEFGHVMHAVCSQSRFSVFGWAWSAVPYPGGVEYDFLEAP